MKIIYSLFLAVLCSPSLFSQVNSLVIENSTDCFYNVRAYATDTITDSTFCDTLCSSAVYCIAPHSSVTIATCSQDSAYQWDHVVVTTSAENCQLCERSQTFRVTSPYGPGCTNYGNPVSGVNECGLCKFKLTFVTPDQMNID